jgi:hypothetical protein
MRDSSTYQWIVNEGRVEGALSEARKIVLRIGRIRFGQPSAMEEATLQAISDLDQLERLSDQLVTVASWRELLATL